MDKVIATKMGNLKLKDDILTPTDLLTGELILLKKVSGKGKIKLKWVDSFGRIVEERTQEVNLCNAESIPIHIPLDKALILENKLIVSINVGDYTQTDSASFVVGTKERFWDDYRVIMYYPYKSNQQMKLWDIGVNAGQIQGKNLLKKDGGALWTNYNFHYYCEQILNWIYAAYHYSHSNMPEFVSEVYNKTIDFINAKKAYKKDRTKKGPLFRKPCFHDPEVKETIEDKIALTVKINRKYQPIFYSLSDEAGIGDLVAAFDFCYDPRALRAMRKWLRNQYGTLKSLNEEWETNFPEWNKVVPLTTDETMKRNSNNFSSWADHRTFMEITFAEAVKWGVNAVKRSAPEAYVGLTGCQMPSAFGGYDYWRLSQILTCIEPYNIGNSREVWRSFNPEAPACITLFGGGKKEQWRLWYQLLHGDRGVIIYDEKNRYLKEDGSPTGMGEEAAKIYTEFTNGICKLLSNSTRTVDPIAIHYSQSSIHAHWMIERRVKGENWIEGGSASERQSDFLRLRESFVKVTEDNLLQYNFISYEQIEDGTFNQLNYKVLILPQSIAMSPKEVTEVEKFVQDGGVLIADSRSALMEHHCKLLSNGQLDHLFGISRSNSLFKSTDTSVFPTGKSITGLKVPSRSLKIPIAEPSVCVDEESGAVALYTTKSGIPAVIIRKVGKGYAIYLNLFVTDYHRWRLKPGQDQEKDTRELFMAIYKFAGIMPEYQVTRSDGSFLPGVEIHPYINGETKIIGIHRNPQLRIDELGSPEYNSNAAFEQSENIIIDLGATYAVYNQRSGNYLGFKQKVVVKLNPWEPIILSLLNAPITGINVTTPEVAKRGELFHYRIELTEKSGAKTDVFRVEIINPEGKRIREYSNNVRVPGGKFSGVIPFALNDAVGKYIIKATDVLTGKFCKKFFILQ